VADSRVDWYGDDVILTVGEATDELLTRLAFQGEGLAKIDAPVDTGFMRNAIYGLGPNGSHRSEAQGGAAGAADRELGAEPRLSGRTAAIHGAALYTIHQEERTGFMYRALERLRDIAAGEIKQVGREYLD